MGREHNQYATRIRQMLQNPPNAVPDTGIDLKRPKPAELLEPCHLAPAPIISLPKQKPIPPPPPPAPTLSVKQVTALVSKHSGYSAGDLRSRARPAILATTRQVIYWLCVKHFPRRPLTQLGRCLDRDHSTVIHGNRKIALYIDSGCSIGAYVRILISKVEKDLDAIRELGPGLVSPTLYQSIMEGWEGEESIQKSRVCILDQ